MRRVDLLAFVVAAAVIWPTQLIGQQQSLSAHDALRVGTALPLAIVTQAWLSREVTVQSVYRATQLSGTGRVTNTGTLTEMPGGQVTYSPLPDNRLVVVRHDGTYEIEVIGVQGGLAASPEAFLNSNYDLQYIYRQPDTVEFEIRTIQIGPGFAATIKGWIVHDGDRYELDVGAEGGSLSEHGGRAGTENQTQYKLTGSAAGPNAELTIAETHFAYLVSHGNDVVTQSRDTSGSIVRTGGDTFRWSDVDVVKVLRSYGANMRPVFDAQTQWKVEGRVLKNDQPFGTYKMETERLGVTGRQEYLGNLLIVIETPTGPYELQRFRGN